MAPIRFCRLCKGCIGVRVYKVSLALKELFTRGVLTKCYEDCYRPFQGFTRVSTRAFNRVKSRVHRIFVIWLSA